MEIKHVFFSRIAGSNLLHKFSLSLFLRVVAFHLQIKLIWEIGIFIEI